MPVARFLYRSYRGFYRFRHWRRQHLTPAGVMMVSVVLVSGVLGANVFRNTLYQVMALACAVMVVSLLSGLKPFRLTVKFKRLLPEYASLNTAVSYEIEIINQGTAVERGLTLYEEHRDPRPSFEALLSGREPHEESRNAWDRKTLYYRWQWLIRKNRKARLRPVSLPDLPPGKPVRIKLSFVPQHRGYLYFSGACFARPDLFGLFNRLFRVHRPEKLLILPKLYPLKIPDLAPRRHYHPGGISLASSIGNSDEFMSLRNYRPGDPMRNVHWRTFAKTRTLAVKEFEDEFFVRHALILDTCARPSDHILFEEAVSIVASYVSRIRTHESVLDLMIAGKKACTFSSGRGLSRPEKMLEILACLEADETADLEGLMPVLQAGMDKFSGAVLVLLDWKEAHKRLCRMFSAAAVPFLAVVVTRNPQQTETDILNDTAIPDRFRVVAPGQIEAVLETA